MHVYMQDPDLQGPRSATTPHLEDCTPYSDDHAACWGWQDAGAIFARPRTIPRTTATPDAIPHSVLPTVFDHCTPAIRGKTTTSLFPCVCTPSLLVTIKGGDGLPLRGDVFLRSSSHEHNAQHSILALASISFSSPLAETWELPTLSRLACTPYYRHLRCKIK